MAPQVRDLLVLGTSSDVGKTLVALGMCRLLHRQGRRVAPFKSMATAWHESEIVETAEGLIHRDQVNQAIAAGLTPSVIMNPVIFLDRGKGLEVYLFGKKEEAFRTFDAEQRLAVLRSVIERSHAELRTRYEHVVIEGCGSPVELNIKDRDISNLWVAERFAAACLLVSNIENTGIFASLVGTVSLMSESERARLLGFIVNKFHGDVATFSDGVRILEERIGKPCYGVVPYHEGLSFLDYERGLPTAKEDVAEQIDRWSDHLARHLDPALLGAIFEETAA